MLSQTIDFILQLNEEEQKNLQNPPAYHFYLFETMLGLERQMKKSRMRKAQPLQIRKIRKRKLRNLKKTKRRKKRTITAKVKIKAID